MQTIFSEQAAPISVLVSAADRYDTNPSSAGVDMALADHVTFHLQEGAGGTGTAKLQVTAEKRDGTGAEAIPFYHRASAVGVFEPLGDLVKADATTGFTTLAGANKQVVVEVPGVGVPEDKPIVRLKITEVANSPVNAGVMAIASRLRYAGATLPNVRIT